MNNEVWKDVPQFEGIYKISNHGNAISFKDAKKENGRLLKLSKNRNSLMFFSASKKIDGVRYAKSIMVHRMVFDLFAKDIPSERYNVKHIDGQFTNNHISNLRCEKPRNKAYDNVWF